MKKLCVFASFVLLAAAASAQSSAKIGIKGGLNLANLNIPNVTTDVRLAPHVGLLAHIHLSDQIGFQPELLYSAQGAEYNVNNNKYNLNLDYISVPLMLQYMFDNGFRIEAGPQLGFLASAKLKGPSQTTDEKQYYKKIDAGLGFGLSYLSYSGLGIGGRYNLGLSNINDAGSNVIKNRVGQISLFYMLDNNHKARSK